MPITDASVSKILETLQEQMQEIKLLRSENTAIKEELREKEEEIDDTRRRRANTERPKRPTIEVGIDDTDWAVFKDSWERYKKMTDLVKDDHICLELRAACSNDVNKLLFEFIGADTLNKPNLTENELLGHIQAVAVKSIHKEVHRMNFGQLHQGDGEAITNFVARLKSQATLCDFTMECSCHMKVSFAEEMISQRLTAGISNSAYQSKILSEADSLSTLESKINRLIGLETTDNATSQMKPPTTGISAAARSSYKKEQHHPPKGISQDIEQRDQRYFDRNQPSANTTERRRTPKYDDKNRSQGRQYAPKRCNGCGKTSHGPGKSIIRTDCPSYGRKCSNCGVMNHFSNVCYRARANTAYADNYQHQNEHIESTEDHTSIEKTKNRTSHSY